MADLAGLCAHPEGEMGRGRTANRRRGSAVVSPPTARTTATQPTKNRVATTGTASQRAVPTRPRQAAGTAAGTARARPLASPAAAASSGPTPEEPRRSLALTPVALAAPEAVGPAAAGARGRRAARRPPRPTLTPAQTPLS